MVTVPIASSLPQKSAPSNLSLIWAVRAALAAATSVVTEF
jgi:hypothetical protein